MIINIIKKQLVKRGLNGLTLAELLLRRFWGPWSPFCNVLLLVQCIDPTDLIHVQRMYVVYTKLKTFDNRMAFCVGLYMFQNSCEHYNGV